MILKPLVIRFSELFVPMEHTIKLKLETKNRLKSLGHKDQTYDEIVRSILDTHNFGENQ